MKETQLTNTLTYTYSVCVCVRAGLYVCVRQTDRQTDRDGWLVVACYGISTFVGYLMTNPFLYKLIYFKQSSLARLHTLIVNNISFSSYSV